MMKQEIRTTKTLSYSKPQKKSSIGNNGSQLSRYIGWTKLLKKRTARENILQWEQEGEDRKFGQTHRPRMQGLGELSR